MADNYDVQRLDKILDFAKTNRRKWEIQAFINMEFIEGNHYVKYDTTTGKIDTFSNNRIQRTVNKVRTQVRGIKNVITKNDPRWHIKGSRGQEVTEEEIDVANVLMQTIYTDEDMRDKTKDLIFHALTKTWACFFVYYDPKRRENGDICVEVEDPLDLYPDPLGYLDGARLKGKYIIRTVRKSIGDLKKVSYYDQEKVSKLRSDQRLAESDWKVRYLANRGENYSAQTDDATSTVILQEFYIMEDEGVRRITKVGKEILHDLQTDLQEFPFLFYQPERQGGKLYFNSWIQPNIEMNKLIDRTLSKMEEWAMIFAVGRVLKQKDSSFSNMLTENGQIIEYSGTPPQYWQPGSPGEVPFALMSNAERFIEDNGIHSDTLGRLSGSANSGVAIAQLQAADLQNMAEPVENLKTTLEDLGELVLKIASKEYKTVRKLYKLEDDSHEAMEIKGSEAESPEEKELTGKYGTEKGVTKVKPLSNISVEIIPGSAFTDMMMRQDLIELKKLGVRIPDDYIIEAYKLGNTADILAKWREEQEEENAQSPDVQIAEGENKKMMMGQRINPNPSDDHRVHLSIHAGLLQNVQDNPQVAQMLMFHMEQHKQAMQGGQPPANNADLNVKGSQNAEVTAPPQSVENSQAQDNAMAGMAEAMQAGGATA